MAPSPAAGKKAPKLPSTPTKAGKNPASSATPKLGGATDTAKITPTSGKKAPKLGPKSTDSPKLPPRPKAADKATEDVEDETEDKGIDLKDNDPEDTVKEIPGKISQPGNETGTEGSSTGDLEEAVPEPVEEAEDEAEETVGGVKDTAEGVAGDDDEEEEGEEEEGEEEEEGDDEAEGVTGKASGMLGKATGMAGKAAGGLKSTAGKTAKGVSGGDPAGAAKGTAEGLKDTATDTAGEAQDTAEDAAGDVGDVAEDATNGVEDAAPDVDGVDIDGVNGVKDTVEDTAEGAQDTAEGVADEAEGAAEDVADGELPDIPIDLSILKGLEVGEGGEILGADGSPFGQLEEGNPEDLIGQIIGDNGEILDEDGDVIGRATVNLEKAKEMAEQAKADAEAAAEGAAETVMPDIDVLKGLEVGEDGNIMGPDGNALGKIVEGDPADFVGQTVNEKGEVLDDDGDVIGRAEVLPQEVKDAAKSLTPDFSILKGKKINKKGNILDEEGEPIGKLTEGSDIKACAGKIPNEKGEILDKEGNVIGNVEVVPGEAADEAMKELHPELVEELEKEMPNGVEEAVDGVPELPEIPGMEILEGLKVNKNGEVLNEDGEPIAKLSEGELADVKGKKINEKGEVLDKEGNVIGKVELIPEAFGVTQEQLDQAQEAAEDAAEDVAEDAADAAPELPEIPGLDVLEGYKVNKKGEIINEDGEVIGKLAEGTKLADAVGKKVNEKGEVVDKEGNVVGKVELVPEAFGVTQEQLDQAEEAAKDLGPDMSILDGLKVNKKGEVVNEDGDVIARLSEGELANMVGKKLNEKGEIVDSEGNVVGKVELIQEAAEEELEDAGPELPPLSILEGLKCNKFGKIVNADGKPIGELVEGDPKKLAKSGVTCDAEGQFWDTKGKVVGRAVTLPEPDEDEEALFSGLEGLMVVKDGWVEDENGHRVGQLVEGDPKKLIGRSVDEDGDIIDKKGNIVGHAERYEEPEEPEVEKVDLSSLKGLTCNKQGNVIGPDGVPIARLVEGNPKELAGKKIDAEGQIWNDVGVVVGRCEMIPFDQREAKAEGPFAGLEGVVVVKDGWVEDEDGNRVGQVVEGDPKKLIGRAVDEDGDIIDKYGNVKGHAEPWEEEEEAPVDLSILAGKVVNKAGNVVDEHGTIFGRIVEGDPTKLAGRKVDGEGQIWSDDGKVIGKAELIPGGDQSKPEGPFSGFEKLVVAKDGLVIDGSGQIVGRVIEGDAKQLMGREVDPDGDILDRAGNKIGKAERWEPEEKKKEISPMSGRKVNKEGEVRDADGNLIGMLTEGNLQNLIGKEIDDNGYVVDNEGNKIGECTLLENLEEEQIEELTEEQMEELRKKKEDNELADRMCTILTQTLERIEPVCKQITEVCFLFPFPVLGYG
jgi:hypothetical protein